MLENKDDFYFEVYRQKFPMIIALAIEKFPELSTVTAEHATCVWLRNVAAYNGECFQ